MAILKCKMCGGDVEINGDGTIGMCKYCGNTMTFPKVSDDQRASLFNRGNHFRRQGEFDKAIAVYEQILRDDDTDAEAHWCCALSRFGIEYVEDPTTMEWLPTCHRASFDSFLEDVDYLAAVANSDGITKRQYQKDALKIADVQKGILATSQNEDPFDVFICYKESDENGNRTKDSTYAQEIYYQLTDAGYKVFFAKITLEDKAGSEYEPYIFAALNSAKVMVVVGTSKEYLDAVWVKNEWSRFLSMMRKDRSKLLIPCYKDMDPYDMPEALSVLQSYDMSKIGFIQDLIRGIKKVINGKQEETVTEKNNSSEAISSAVIEAVKANMAAQQSAAGPNTDALIDRGNMALEDGEWQKADEFFEEVLNQNAKCAEAYVGKLLSSYKKSSIASLTSYYIDKYASADKEKLEACNENAERIQASISQNVVKDYLSEAEISKLYPFDRTYMSELSFRKQQKAKQLAELSEEKLLGRARQYAVGGTKAALDKMLADVTAALDRRIAKAEEEDKEAVESLISSYNLHLNQADAKAGELKNGALQRQEQTYQSKVSQMNAAKTIQDYEKMVGLFKGMNGYKDTMTLADKCQNEADKLKEAERLETERREAARRKEAERRAKKRKRIAIITSIVAVLCVVIIVFVNIIVLPQIRFSNEKNKLKTASVGDVVSFGNYNGSTEWIVLEKKVNKVLIISKYAIEKREYNTKYEEVTWENCSLRKWLNNDYLSSAFSSYEKAFISATSVVNADNSEYGTYGGNDTTDLVFLLSIDEVNKYFSSDSERQTTLTDGTPTWWWLRSSGFSSKSAADVFRDGSVDVYGYGVSIDYGAVRPAMWIDISNL